MAFPESSILDDFNRDNEGPPLSSNWTETGFAAAGLKVVSNVAAQEAVGSCVEYWNAGTFGPNCEAYVTFTVVVNTSKPAVYTRLQAPDTATADGYVLEADAITPNLLKISRLDDGSRTQLGESIAQVINNSDDFGLESSGDDHTAYFNDGGAGWGNVGSRSDDTYQGAGYIGIKIYSTSGTTGRLDDFGGGTLAGGDPTPSLSDGITIGESTAITPLVLPNLSESDGITLGETIAIALGDLVSSPSDDVSVADSPAVQAFLSGIQVSDNVALADSPAVSGLAQDISINIGLDVPAYQGTGVRVR